MDAEMWQQRLRRWMALRARSRRPAAAAQEAPSREVFAAPQRALGIEEFLASASGLVAHRHAGEGGPHWRLRWQTESLPAGPELAGALQRAVGVFSGEGAHEDFGPLRVARPEDLLFLDTETLGLGNAGVFLIGWLGLVEGRLVAEQLLAQDYSEEPAILRAFARSLEGRGVLISFNGKSFDLPLLSCRAGMWQVELGRAGRMPHVDLLYECRRRWSASLPDCRLQTVESALSGRRREDDVPGWQIPAVYHEFVRGGDARPLGPILRHNMLDLAAMVEILLECLG